jgi:nicotinate-nucleotide pyrophosphorylase (carboxylating)
MTIEELIKSALEEDIGDGDHTTLSTVPPQARGKVKMIAKQNGIVAGIEVAEKVFKAVDPGLKIEKYLTDGQPLKTSDVIMRIEGKSQSLLTAERTALNFIQRMSGIATYTRSLVNKLSGLNTRILDTRKTTPCNRIVEKMAVKAGGGENHRFGLYDMIMIKDNHIDFAGGIKQAIEATLKYLDENGKDLKIEIEVRNFDELYQVLETGGVHRIMLDNFSTGDLYTAVKMIDGKYETEASGGITESTIREYAETGVDFISVGALTHHIKSLDISLKADL